MKELDKRRRASVKAVQLLQDMLLDIGRSQQLHQAGTGRLVCAFEWSRHKEGWDFQAVRCRREPMPLACDFDACHYGFNNKKPWEIITNCRALQRTQKSTAQPPGAAWKPKTQSPSTSPKATLGD